MRIRLAHHGELNVLDDIVKAATRQMDEQGIPQWDEIYPNKEVLSKDIQKQELHVIEVEGRVTGLVVINDDQSPEYAALPWMYPGHALVVHRLTIHPAYQRNGLATRLCLLKKTAHGGQWRISFLHTHSHNKTDNHGVHRIRHKLRLPVTPMLGRRNNLQ